jgi:hypothetical protein
MAAAVRRAAGVGGGGPRGPAAAAAAGEALRAALLANANLGGDSTHRGALLGAVLGACCGAAAIPRDLLAGLAAFRGPAAPAVDAIASAVEGAVTTGAAAHRFGRPAPLARAPAPIPRDFPGKLAAVAAEADAAGGLALLRYVKGYGPCVKRGGALVPLRGGGRALPPRAPALAVGDAERDRLALLAEEGGGAPSAARALASGASGGAALAVPVALAHAAEGPAAELEGARGAAGAPPGTGVFYVPAPGELAARLAAVAEARRAAAAAGAVDPVVVRLASEYGVDVAPFFRARAVGAHVEPLSAGSAEGCA